MYATSADFFSIMSEDDALTSQQTPHNTNSDNLKSVKRDYVKCRWYKKSEILTHTAIKEQIGNCTLCLSLPSSDCVQLPKCLCYFCRECFNLYLDKFATPKPVKRVISVIEPGGLRKRKKVIWRIRKEKFKSVWGCF